MAPTAPTAANQSGSAKKKGKKNADPLDARKQLEAKIAQLELDAAGEKDQEAEIDRETRRHNREVNHDLSKFDAPMVRLSELQKRYSNLFADMKRTERELVKAKKRGDLLQKEKEAVRGEMVKVTSAKDKLDKISRDWAEQNKKLRTKCDSLEDSERRMKVELHERIEQMEEDVATIIEQNERPEPSEAQLDTDELFRAKFKSFIEQWELRELQYHSLYRMKELEVQYEKARFEQQKKAQEVESSKSNQLTRQVSTFSQTETELRSQLNIYVEKFKQMEDGLWATLRKICNQNGTKVEDTLNNSNDLFLTFRKEMEEMSKKTKRLEKENQTLTRKQEATNRNILEMAEERTRNQQSIEVLTREREKLRNIIRAMQDQGRTVPQEAHDAITPASGATVNGHSSTGGPVAHEDVMAGNFADDADEEATDSEYEYDDDDEEGSDEYDDETEEEDIHNLARPFGPVPPPPPPKVVMSNGRPKSSWEAQKGANGVKQR